MFYEVKINQSYQNVTIKMGEKEVDDFKWFSKNQML